MKMVAETSYKVGAKRVHPLIQLWVTPKLPREHIFISPAARPEKFSERLSVYLRKWVAHPIKRRVAKYYLIFLRKFFGLEVIGITGSAGKTTTKEMVASILNQKGKTIATYKNIDSVYNIPSTILSLSPSVRYLVLEMGVEFPGEMDFYLWLAKPDIGVLTNIYPTHTQFLRDINGVAREKLKLIRALPKNKHAVLNIESGLVRKLTKGVVAKKVWYGNGGIVMAEDPLINQDMKTEYTLKILQSKISIQLSLLGQQFVSNSLAAASVGYLCGVSLPLIKTGLENFKQGEHRMQVIRHPFGAIILDDSYNNNPEAARAALKTLASISKGKKMVVIFGDMLELGRFEKRYHRQMGKFIASLDVNFLLCVGKLSKIVVNEASKEMPAEKLAWVENAQDAYSLIRPMLKKRNVILVKGSRSIGLDKLVKRLSG
jgi:UDP-N-acetylmuramoyl-tripeptide--D-alanyl-D-alanine ligase